MPPPKVSRCIGSARAAISSQHRAQARTESRSGTRPYGRQYETGPPSVASAPAAHAVATSRPASAEPCRTWTGKSCEATPSSTSRVRRAPWATRGKPFSSAPERSASSARAYSPTRV